MYGLHMQRFYCKPQQHAICWIKSSSEMLIERELSTLPLALRNFATRRAGAFLRIPQG
jgi:hypothetical protein